MEVMGKARHLSFDSFKCETNALNVLDGVHQWIKLAFGAMAELDSGVEVTLPACPLMPVSPHYSTQSTPLTNSHHHRRRPFDGVSIPWGLRRDHSGGVHATVAKQSAHRCPHATGGAVSGMRRASASGRSGLLPSLGAHATGSMRRRSRCGLEPTARPPSLLSSTRSALSCLRVPPMVCTLQWRVSRGRLQLLGRGVVLASQATQVRSGQVRSLFFSTEVAPRSRLCAVARRACGGRGAEGGS